MMINILIDGKEICASADKNLLQVAQENRIDIPYLCFFKECNNIGQCGICLVEVDGQEKLSRACCVKPKEGMSIITNSDKVVEARKQVISQLLDRHDFKCGACKRKL